MPKEEFSLRPQETPEKNEEKYNLTPEDKEMILEMQGVKGVKKVITPKDRRREKKAADEALEAMRRKILGEKEGQQELLRE
ncbi:MAG: hypothetical protein HYY55_03640 [Candidatus Niyogibacteria bacterium]|nr:MAG: hypothetical protein HYY55_03640 [Candidatus Niyogibacteria bacterium]